MAANTAQEQLMLELINRARMSPSAEASRFGISLNQGLPTGAISTMPKQVLAMNDLLVQSADRHSNWMLNNDQFSHQELANSPSGRTGLDPDDRMSAAGYSFIGTWSWGENISWTGTTGTINLTNAILEQHRSLFLSPGHRNNILEDSFREIGIGQQVGTFTSNGANFNASMVTQNFALSGAKVFVTGVVYNDTVTNDNFFTVGEQAANLSVAGSGGFADVTGAGGGYELGFITAGAKTITFNLAGGAVAVNLALGATNLKVDVVNGNEIWTNTNLSVVSGPVAELHALGIMPVSLTGGAGNESLFGNAAANRLAGAGGNDTLQGGLGADTMAGGVGSDTYYVDNAGDKITEANVTGSDRVYSSVSFSIGGQYVESLTLTGTTNINGTGSSLNNTLTGNSGANILNGSTGNDSVNGGGGNDTIYGGVGNDTLTGGANSDRFVFNTALNQTTNVDRVNDFNVVSDTILLENTVFQALGSATGPLTSAMFWMSTSGLAHDSNDRIVYETDTGNLVYDANGNAAGGSIHFATLSAALALSYADFLVI